MAATAHFSAVVESAGNPELYLPLADPKRDRNFMRAVREQRVLSVKQEPTGTKKDFGTVGFVAEKYLTYLIFPKPLTAFAGKRIVGIKYEAVREADLSTARAVAAPKRSTKPASPKPKPKPRPKRFTAKVRVTSTNEIKVSVKAFDQAEARSKAEQEIQKKVRSKAGVATELLTLTEDE